MAVHPLNWPAQLTAAQCLELRGLLLEELAGDADVAALIVAGADQAIVELLEARQDTPIERPRLSAEVLEGVYASVDGETAIEELRTLVTDLEVTNARGERTVNLRSPGWVKRLASLYNQALITAEQRDAIAALATVQVSAAVARWGQPLTHQDVAIALRGHVNGYRDPVTKEEANEVSARDAEQATARLATAARFGVAVEA